MKSTIAKKTEGYGYKYTELADINKYCEENNIKYFQEVETSEINQEDYIITYLIQDGATTRHKGCKIVNAVLQGIKNPVQEYGSSITYCRRYSLLMALGLATEDDDGATFTEKKEATEEEAVKWSFSFGKYKGKTMLEVLQENKKYVEWYLNNKASEYDIKCYELLTGEKMPTEKEVKENMQIQIDFLDLVKQTNTDIYDIEDYFKVDTYKQMTNEQYKQAIKMLNQKLEKINNGA